MKKALLACVAICTIGMATAAAEPCVSATTDRQSYAVGDVVNLTVQVSGNTGFHGLFFDLRYDPDVFAFVSATESDLPIKANAEKADSARLLYAVSSPRSGAPSQRLVMSFTYADPAGTTSRNGRVATAKFRVIGRPSAQEGARFSFDPASSRVYGLGESILEQFRFVDSALVSVKEGERQYVQINAPPANQAVYDAIVALSATSTPGIGYTYRVRNEDTGYESDPLSAQSGSLNDFNIELAVGLNRLAVELRDANGNILATDTRTVARSSSASIVRIVSPVDHALVNTDRVRFVVASTLSAVTVNGVVAEPLPEKQEGKNLFAASLWLKKGFNEIVAQGFLGEGAGRIAYTHSITVFYQRDDLSFRFLRPLADSTIRLGRDDPQLRDGSLVVSGEIGSQVNPDGSNTTVMLRVEYNPTNPALKSRTIVYDRAMTIEENAGTYADSQAPYVFKNDFAIDVSGLENGELTITAYKNKSGLRSEAEIVRVVSLCTDRLEIELTQPNIFGVDILDTKTKIKAFNAGEDPVPMWDNVNLFKDGRIGLAPKQRLVKRDAQISGSSVVDIIECADGTRYALVNAGNEMRLYRRDSFATSWGANLLKNCAMHGYALCETDRGVLIGVSNSFTTSNSGLYLFDGTGLVNVSIGKPIPHVQFIECRDGKVFLYGNDYSHIYSFDLYSLQLIDGRYATDDVSAIPCDNDEFLSDFCMGDDGKTVLMLTTDGRLIVAQNLDGTGFERGDLSATLFPDHYRFSSIIRGSYDQGYYNAYLVLPSADSEVARVIMENKSTNRLVPCLSPNGLFPDGQRLIGATFSNGEFVFMYRSDEESAEGYTYSVRRGTVLFNELSLDNEVETFVSPSVAIEPGLKNRHSLLSTKDSSYTVGYGADLAVPAVFEFINTYPENGEIAFSYRNADAELIKGFSFQVDPSWKSTDKIRLSFTVRDVDTGARVFGTTDTPVSLASFLAANGDLYQVSSAYDQQSGMEIVTVEFVSPETDRYVDFHWVFSPIGNASTSISNLSVSKKTTVKLPVSDGDTMLLPIFGRVSDRTVSSIKIQECPVPIDKNGYFSYMYELNTAQAKTTITLSCSNQAGESAALTFIVNIFDSVAVLSDVVISAPNGSITPDAQNPSLLIATGDRITVSATAMGLDGMVLGYETHFYVDGVGTTKLASSGLFSFDPVPTTYQVGEERLNGYVTGRIESQEIELISGTQRLVIYAENPGGKRAIYVIDGKVPDVQYVMPASEQRIEILTPTDPLMPVETVSTVPVDKQMDLTVNETTASPYVFKRTFTIRGQVKSPYALSELRIKSPNGAIRFAEGAQEILVPVDELNRFSVEATVTLPEAVDEGRYPILFVPTAPFLEHNKTGVMVNAKKDFTNTFVVPDFSPMDARNWTAEELAALEKPIRVRIARHIPQGTTLSLIVNYGEPFSGKLVREGSTEYYALKNESGGDVKLAGLKTGMNRIRWELSRNGIISSSVSGRVYGEVELKDYLLEIVLPEYSVSTLIAFPVTPGTYYSKTADQANGVVALPVVSISKQTQTGIRIVLNGEVASAGSAENVYQVNLLEAKYPPKEGLNHLDVFCEERVGATVSMKTLTYRFLYDSKAPVLKNGGYTYKKNATTGVAYLSSFAAVVTEANLKTIALHQMIGGARSQIGSNESYTIEDLGNDTYRVTWSDLDEYDPPIRPSESEYVYVVAEDYAGNTASTETTSPFYGVGVLADPTPLDIKPFPISSVDYATHGFPRFMYENERWGNSDFLHRAKIYNSNIAYRAFSTGSSADYLIARPGKVTLTDTVSGLPTPGSFTVSAMNGTQIDKNFQIRPGQTLDIKPVQGILPSPMIRKARDADSTVASVGFWIRHEVEPEYMPDTQYRTILSLERGALSFGDESPLKSYVNDEDLALIEYDLYLAYRDIDTAPDRYGDEQVGLFLKYDVYETNGEELELVTSTIVPLIENRGALLTLNRGGYSGVTGLDAWNLVSVSEEKRVGESGGVFFRVCVNDKEPAEVFFEQAMNSARSFRNLFVDQDGFNQVIGTITSSFMKTGNEYVFGNTNGGIDLGGRQTSDRTSENGHFSIAQPFYTDALVSNYDIIVSKHEITGKFGNTETPADDYANPSTFRPVEYEFYRDGDDLSSFNNAYLGLRLHSQSSNMKDYYSSEENADYASAAGSGDGSFLATSYTLNRLKLQNGQLMFRDSSMAFYEHMNVEHAAGWLTLTPNQPNVVGRYSFANNYGNHTLVNDRWYSVYGRVEAIGQDATVDATLVLVINGVERRYKMESGDFHYVFANDGSTPRKVVMYIETKTPIRLSDRMFLTEGNYRLPSEAFGGIVNSCASTKYLSQREGTIDFWYKPLIAAKDGFVYYAATLFESDFATIRAVPNNGGPATFTVHFNGRRDAGVSANVDLTTDLVSSVPARYGWQHIQLSWDLNGGTSVAYLYVNGEIAASVSGNHVVPVSESMLGVIPAVDNVYIGSNINGNEYARGYIDSVRIDNVYDTSRYDDNRPILVSYTDGYDGFAHFAPRLSIHASAVAGAVSAFTYDIRDERGDLIYRHPVSDGGALPGDVDISSYEPGMYTVYVQALVNGFRYAETFEFVKNDKPRFIHEGNTPIVVSGLETDLNFEFGYETANLLEKDLELFAGIELTVSWVDGITTSARTYYVVQDPSNYVHNGAWLIYSSENGNVPEAFTVQNNKVRISAHGIRSTSKVDWTYRPFYFDLGFVPSAVSGDVIAREIPLAGLDTLKPSTISVGTDQYEYKLDVKLRTEGTIGDSDLNGFAVSYDVTAVSGGATKHSSRDVAFDRSGSLTLFYDDVFNGLGYGTYNATVNLEYQGTVIGSYPVVLNYRKIVQNATMEIDRYIGISELSVIQLLSEGSEFAADMYLGYDISGFDGDNDEGLVGVMCQVAVFKELATGKYSRTYTDTRLLPTSQRFAIIKRVPLEIGTSIVQVRVYEQRRVDGVLTEGLSAVKEVTVTNKAKPPQVVLTNSVDSRIAYNNVAFSWIGYYENTFEDGIAYTYTLDDRGWSTPSSEWRSVEYYGLEEGDHRFSVKAIYGENNESPEAVCRFYVDVTKPLIDPVGSKITVKKNYDQYGFMTSVDIIGAAGAIVDRRIASLIVNGEVVDCRGDGSFAATSIPVLIDGKNEYLIEAIDLVGNRAEKKIVVDNTITELLYPVSGAKILYTPITLVGRFPAKVNNLLDIYVKDPLTQENKAGDFSGWRKARVNEDFTFFVDDLTINPGTSSREARTSLEIAVVSKGGHVYRKTVEVSANEVSRPIDLTLSLHAAEGEQADTEITISAKANVPNISSWSVDYTGDGIYDEVMIMDDPSSSQSCEWTHAYSSLGVVNPRVRAITKSGIYFSTSDTLVIHEKIREASNKAIVDAVAFSVLSMPNDSQRVYVLAGKDKAYRIEVYEIGRNESYISNLLYTVKLAGMGITAPVRILALDKGRILVAENLESATRVQTLVADDAEIFSVVDRARITLAGPVSDMDHDGKSLYITYLHQNYLTKVSLVDGIPKPDTKKDVTVPIESGLALGGRMSVSRDSCGMLLADYDHQRIVRLSDSFIPLEYHGEQGLAEGEFIKPALVKSYQNRLFVYDAGRKDVQFFDPEFRPITRLWYDPANQSGNYLDSRFFDNVVGVSAFAREEAGRLYYYAVMLSASSSKLSVIKMPQWEELRAKTRNNMIIFVKDNEVFSAKPTGSDLSRLISSDSIPRISGSVDYPAMSPDGKMITFTSRAKLYDGSGSSTAGNEYAYDNLYVMNTDGTGLTRIPLAEVQGFEIERPQFNSNGTQLVFSAKPTGGTWQLYIYDFAKGSVVRVFATDENARFPYFSPDDRFIAFTTDYDGDEEVQIYDTKNPTMRISVTKNAARDSYPVWGTVYPDEIKDADSDIESKIAYVSERGSSKAVYYSYVSRPSESDIRIVTSSDKDVGGDPDAAAIKALPKTPEGEAQPNAATGEYDYPSFTGDGEYLVYENFELARYTLQKYGIAAASAERVRLMDGARRPAGMKNTITCFVATIVDGNAVRLSWNRYTEADVYYMVRFKQKNTSDNYVEKRVFTQDGTYISGLEMGIEYLFQVAIQENGEDVAKTQWVTVKVPEVVARPSFSIDKDNPYLVRLTAWKPKEDTDWGFSWIIDNQEIAVQSSSVYLYEFATSGTKTIMLKAHNKANTYSTISDPMTVNIVSDIKPVIEYYLAPDKSYIDVSAKKSLGNKIAMSSAVWTVTGPGVTGTVVLNQPEGTIPIGQFRNKVNLHLQLSRVAVNGQTATDVIETTKTIDITYDGTKVVITQEADASNKRLITFSGANSIGNLNWKEAQWNIFRNGQVLQQRLGVSSFAFEFPESGSDARYSVSLTVPSMNAADSYTANSIVSIEATPLEPVIDYEVVTMKDAEGKVTGAKLIFSAANSRGNDIDYASAKWTVPIAGAYGEEPTQIGPTAVYNLFNLGDRTQAEVSLTLMRRGGTDAKTIKKTIDVKTPNVPKPEIIVKSDYYDTGLGKACKLDVLSSVGANIDWERTSWQFSSKYVGQTAIASTATGPTALLEFPASAEDTVIRYTVRLYLFGSSAPLVKTEELRIGAKKINPRIKADFVSGGNGKVANLSVLDTRGVNIDWERTTWYFYDGSDQVVQKYGATVTHSFVKREKAMGYPIVVLMYYKNDSKPFYGYSSIDIDADQMVPAISWDRAEAKSGSEILFSAETSTGSGIEWSQAKWSFGDGSPAEYGATASHKYPDSGENKDYKVSVTLTRTLANGQKEVKTTTTTVNITRDEIRPVIKATLHKDGYLVLTAEGSEGRGLLLNQSTWMFAGKGDNENVNISKQTGTSSGVTETSGWNVGVKNTLGTIEAATFLTGTEISGGTSGSTSDSTSVSDSLSSTDSFSNENYHVGMTARRWIGDYDIYAAKYETKKTITVTLSVYRVDADGGMKGQTITVNINLADAVNGVTYP